MLRAAGVIELSSEGAGVAGAIKRSAHQWVKNLSVFSTSMLGTLNAMTSYGAALNSRYLARCQIRCGQLRTSSASGDATALLRPYVHQVVPSAGKSCVRAHWYLRSVASFRCSKDDMKRCRGFSPSSISGYST